jgi:hypothetical protein
MANKNINIKVNRLIAITELENKLVAAKAADEAYEKDMQAFKEALAQFETDVKNELLAGNFEFVAPSYSSPIDTYGSDGTIRAYMKLTNMPKEPTKPSSNRPRNHVSSSDIERMIRLLKMSTDESVSTKVYDSLGEML